MESHTCHEQTYEYPPKTGNQCTPPSASRLVVWSQLAVVLAFQWKPTCSSAPTFFFATSSFHWSDRLLLQHNTCLRLRPLFFQVQLETLPPHSSVYLLVVGSYDFSCLLLTAHVLSSSTTVVDISFYQPVHTVVPVRMPLPYSTERLFLQKHVAMFSFNPSVHSVIHVSTLLP